MPDRVPQPARPWMPGYGIAGPDDGGGLLPFDFAESRLASAHDYWVATITEPLRRPHVMPVWGVWLDGRFWFSSSNASRKARNIEANPNVTVATDDPHQPVVLEGHAGRLVERRDRVTFNDVVNAKYETDYTVDFYDDSAVFAVTPLVVFALDDANFTGSPTRWTWPPSR